MTGQTPGSAGGGLKQVFATGLTETSLTDVEGIGTIRFEDGKWYKWVKYDDGSGDLDIVAGDVLVYIAVTGYAASLVTADLTDGDGLTVPAGVAVATVTVDATFMWIQIKGFVTFSLDVLGTTPVDGDSLTSGLTAGTDKAAINDPPLNRMRLGVSLDDSAKTAILECPF